MGLIDVLARFKTLPLVGGFGACEVANGDSVFQGMSGIVDNPTKVQVQVMVSLHSALLRSW